MKRLALIAALAVAACGSGAPQSVEHCWEDAVNRPASEGGCQEMTDPLAVDWCLAHWDDVCRQNTD